MCGLGVEFYNDEAAGDFRVTGKYEGIEISCKLLSSPAQVVRLSHFSNLTFHIILYSLYPLCDQYSRALYLSLQRRRFLC